jgi:hypothetical protein
MSVEYNAAIVVGAEWNSINGDAIQEKISMLVECGELDDFPPYYDGYGQGLFGIYLNYSPDYGYSEVIYTEDDVAKAKAEFESLTGMEGKVYLTVIGS